jgi:purine-binding chemotaxis protein CheW
LPAASPYKAQGGSSSEAAICNSAKQKQKEFIMEGTSSEVMEPPAGSATGRAGKYLTFKLQEEEYGLEILKVREIMGLLEITTVPRTPSFVRGVINLRGKVIPVVDLRTKFGMPTAKDTEQTCIIVVDVRNVEMGIVVDAVSEVLDIAENEIVDPPSFGVNVDMNFILGMGKAKGKVTMLLDIGKVLTLEDVTAIAKIRTTGGANPGK